MKFEITENAKKAVIKHLSKEGLLEFCIERTQPNQFVFTGLYDGLEVIKLPVVTIYPGDSLTITEMKIVLELD